MPLVRNGDFRLDEDADGVADGWTVTTTGQDGSSSLEQIEGDELYQKARVTSPDANGRIGIMLARHDVPVKAGEWYRISLKAKADLPPGTTVTLAIQNMKTWLSFFDYQRSMPDKEWREFVFLVQAKDSAETDTRFQSWHSGTGTVWYRDVRMAPVRSPEEGRWLAGLHLDEPEDWDYPYRFFRW